MLRAGLPLDPAVRALARIEAAQDRMRAFTIDIGGVPAAFGLCRSKGTRVEYLHTGYNPEHRELSLGVLLLDLMLGALMEERRYDLLDLGHGDAQYKREFATRTLDCATIYAYRPSLRNRMLLAAHAANDRLSASAVGALDAAGLTRTLKRWTRG